MKPIINSKNNTNLYPTQSRLIAQLGLPLGVLFVLLTGVFTLFIYLLFETVHKTEVNSVQEFAGNTAISVGRLVNTSLQAGAFPARLASTSLNTSNREHLQNFVDSVPSISALYFYDIDGNFIWNINRTGATTSLVKFSPSVSTEKIIGEPEVDSSGAPFLLVQYPVFETQGNLSGYSVVQYDLSFLWEVVSGPTGINSAVVDRRGRVFMSTVKGDQGGGLQKIIANYLDGKQGVVYSEQENSETNIQAWGRVEEFPWAVISWESYDILLQEMLHMFQIVAGAFVVFSLLIVYEVRALGRLLFRPLREISESATKMAQGNLDVWIPSSTNNELGALASTLNTLAFRLRSLYHNLEGRVQVALEQARKDEEEAQRLNSFMVHREIKMAELKEEVRRLKARSETSVEKIEPEEGGNSST